MRSNADHATRRIRLLFISTLTLAALGLLAATSGTAAQGPAGGRKQAAVTVQGMQCPFCAYGIKKHLAKIPGVTRVDLELAKNQAIVTVAPEAKVTDTQIQQAIRKAGFTPGQDRVAVGRQRRKDQRRLTVCRTRVGVGGALR